MLRQQVDQEHMSLDRLLEDYVLRVLCDARCAPAPGSAPHRLLLVDSLDEGQLQRELATILSRRRRQVRNLSQ